MSEHRIRKSMRTVNGGLAANIILSILKTFFGIVATSTALLADGINSTSDVVYYVVVKIFMRLSGEPADEEHPYGHNQLETIAALVVGAFVITTGVAIFWNSVSVVVEFVRGQSDFTGPGIFALYIAVFTVALKFGLTLWTYRVAKETRNAAIMALAADHRNDILASAAAVTGIILGRIGFYWVDPLAGAVVSLVIIHTGITILRESSADLMDTVPGKTLRNSIMEHLNGDSDIITVEEIHAHRFGPYFVVNLTVGLEGNLNIHEGDCIATRIEETLYRELDFIKKVYVHYHPARKDKAQVKIVAD